MSYQMDSSKLDLKPKRHHGYAVVLFIMGTLFPPMAVAARFGFGKDFWLNLLLTICGYIPGHGHNFYIQNIRNNKNHRRTPKWAQRYGLVDTSELKRKQKKSQWANRYNDRLPQSTLEGQEYEDGQVAGGPSREDSIANGQAGGSRDRDGLWRDDDEQYYGANGDRSSTKSGESGGRWRYPANFEDTLPPVEDGTSGKKKKKKKDRWARTEDAYSIQGDDLPGASERRKRKKKKEKSSKKRSTVGGADGDSFDRRSDSISTMDAPEDPGRNVYADLKERERRERNGEAVDVPDSFGKDGRDVLDHQF